MKEKACLTGEKRIIQGQLKSGDYCNICYRTAIEIERDEKISFQQHLKNVNGKSIPASNAVIVNKSNNYNQIIYDITKQINDLKLNCPEFNKEQINVNISDNNINNSFDQSSLVENNYTIQNREIKLQNSDIENYQFLNSKEIVFDYKDYIISSVSGKIVSSVSTIYNGSIETGNELFNTGYEYINDINEKIDNQLDMLDYLPVKEAITVIVPDKIAEIKDNLDEINKIIPSKDILENVANVSKTIKMSVPIYNVLNFYKNFKDHADNLVNNVLPEALYGDPNKAFKEGEKSTFEFANDCNCYNRE